MERKNNKHSVTGRLDARPPPSATDEARLRLELSRWPACLDDPGLWWRKFIGYQRQNGARTQADTSRSERRTVEDNI